MIPAITEIAIRELFGHERFDIGRIEERIACLLLHVGQGFEQPGLNCGKARVVGEIMPFVGIAFKILARHGRNQRRRGQGQHFWDNVCPEILTSDP